MEGGKRKRGRRKTKWGRKERRKKAALRGDF